jgi:hypothetical protein
MVLVYKEQGAGPREWLGKADVLPWRAAPSMLILAGKQQPPCSFMQARQERSLPCRGSMGDVLFFLSYPFINM